MDKKELIYKAAVKVIAREGFDNTKIQMIAKEAQLAVGTIYNYYKSKNEILEYIICNAYQKRIEYLKKLNETDKPAIDKIKYFLQFHLGTLVSSFDEGKILVQEFALTGGSFNEYIKKSKADMQERLCETIVAAQEQGEVRKSDAVIITAILTGSVKGFMSYFLNGANLADDNTDLVNQAVSFMINGIKINCI